MKNFFFILCLLSLNLTQTIAQINLDHTFITNIGLSWVTTSTKGIMYYQNPDTLTNQLKIFNEDYSLYKTVTIPRPIGYSIYGIYNLSDKLFNSDSNIEFICCFLKYESTAVSKIVLYDENATVIKDFGKYEPYALPWGLINNTIGKTKLCIMQWSTPFKYEIYSIAGNMPSSISEAHLSNKQFAYPNPSNTTINLPYSLDNGQTTTLKIFNINGRLIEQKQIDPLFNKILLNVSSYQSGIYIYEYNGVTNKFTVN